MGDQSPQPSRRPSGPGLVIALASLSTSVGVIAGIIAWAGDASIIAALTVGATVSVTALELFRRLRD